MDSNTYLPRTAIQKLNANNYYIWSNKREVVLRGRGIWRYVDEKGTETGTYEDYVRSQKIGQAIAFLIMFMEDECIAPVIGLRDPKVIWPTLRKMYKAAAEASVDSDIV